MPAEESNDRATPDDTDPMWVRPYFTFTGEVVARTGAPLVPVSEPDTRELVLRPQRPPAAYEPHPQPGPVRRRRPRYLLAVALTTAGAVAAGLVAWGMTSGSESDGASQYVVIQDDPSRGNRGPLISASETGIRGSHSAGPSGTPSGSASAGSSPSGAKSGLAEPSSAPRRLSGLPGLSAGSGGSGSSATATATGTTAGGNAATPTNGAETQQPSSTRSLESVNYPDRYLTAHDDLGYLDQVSSTDSAQTRQDATFTLVSGLADASCYSFMAEDGRYLRHKDFRIHLTADDGSTLFEQDATFCPHEGSVSGSVSFASYNYPGYYLRHRQYELWIDPYQDSSGFRDDSSFQLGASLG